MKIELIYQLIKNQFGLGLPFCFLSYLSSSEKFSNFSVENRIKLPLKDAKKSSIGTHQSALFRAAKAEG